METLSLFFASAFLFAPASCRFGGLEAVKTVVVAGRLSPK